MRCFIAVVDKDGVVLGCIRTPDATLLWGPAPKNTPGLTSHEPDR